MRTETAEPREPGQSLYDAGMKFIICASLITVGLVNLHGYYFVKGALNEGGSKRVIEQTLKENSDSLRMFGKPLSSFMLEVGSPGRNLAYSRHGDRQK